MSIEIKKAMVEKLIEKIPETVKELAKKAKIDDLEEWIKICQEKASSHKNYPRVLQDLINIIGERLGFDVTFGEYEKGPDGIWKYKEFSIVIEVKASSFYYNATELNDRVNSLGATCGIAICCEFMPDRVASTKQYPKLRLITSSSLCKLARLKEEYQLPTEHIVNILIPQETVKLDGLIEVISEIIEVKRGEGPPLVDRYNIDDVPSEIKDLGDVSKAMYIILKENPEREFTAEELSKQILEAFPKTFEGRSQKSISFGTIWSGDALYERGYIIIEKIKPDPEKYPNWIQRKYKFRFKA